MKTFARLLHTKEGRCVSLVAWSEPVFNRGGVHSKFNDGTIGRKLCEHSDVDFKCVELSDNILEYLCDDTCRKDRERS